MNGAQGGPGAVSGVERREPDRGTEGAVAVEELASTKGHSDGLLAKRGAEDLLEVRTRVAAYGSGEDLVR